MGDLWEAVENSISELSQLRVRKAPAEVTSLVLRVHQAGDGSL